MLNQHPEPPPIVSVEYEIYFSDGTGPTEHINPGKAVAWVHSEGRGEMQALKWRITAVGDTYALYSGDGGVVEDAFAEMKANKEDGTYVIKFDMEDVAGESWILSREFAIITN